MWACHAGKARGSGRVSPAPSPPGAIIFSRASAAVSGASSPSGICSVPATAAPSTSTCHARGARCACRVTALNFWPNTSSASVSSARSSTDRNTAPARAGPSLPARAAVLRRHHLQRATPRRAAFEPRRERRQESPRDRRGICRALRLEQRRVRRALVFAANRDQREQTKQPRAEVAAAQTALVKTESAIDGGDIDVHVAQFESAVGERERPLHAGRLLGERQAQREIEAALAARHHAGEIVTEFFTKGALHDEAQRIGRM